MFNIQFSNKAIELIEGYTSLYRKYHQDLYLDSGLWNEELIIEGYSKEAENRSKEILDIVTEKLSSEIISYSQNQVIIRWRTKILLVSFREIEDTRIVTSIDIR